MTARQKPKRILLPLDGSERSLGTVRYIAKLKPFYQMQVVLFHVHAGAPESYFDLGKDPRSTGTVAYVRAWEIEQKKKARDFMEKAGGILLRAGFPEEAVSVKIQKRKQGIARDIIKEAQQDYHAVVVRRRGLRALRGIVLGSVANKLLEKLDFLLHKISGVPVVDQARKPIGVITKTDLFRALFSLTGIHKKGIQFAFQLIDRPGAIRDITDILRDYGGRIASVLSTRGKAKKGFLKVYIHAYGFDPVSRQRVKEVIKDKAPPLYLVDHEAKTRTIHQTPKAEYEAS